MAQLVARLSGGQEAVSSSLATPTKRCKGHDKVTFLFYYKHFISFIDTTKNVIKTVLFYEF